MSLPPARPIPLVDLKAQYISIKPEIDQAIQNILDSTSFILGKPVEQFEQNLAAFCRCQYAIGTSSGTSALFLALKAYGIKDGDEVITVPNSFIATVEAIVHCGAKPVLVDIDQKTMLIDPDKIEAAINPRTRAIIPVHLYGQICDMDKIITLAKQHNLIILEDAAQAIDAEYQGRKLPIHETAIFSFFPAKNLGAYGDAGAIITTDQKIASMVAKLRDHGRIDKYNSDVIGYGERLDALQAAILNVKLNHLPEWTIQRRTKSYYYNLLLQDCSQLVLPYEESYGKKVYYMYVLRTKFRDKLLKELSLKGINCGIHYPIPLHLQPALNYLGYKEGDFPVAEKAAQEILSLPMYPELTLEQVEYIANQVKEIVTKQ